MKIEEAKRIVIIANGECTKLNLNQPGDLVICLNGGTDRALAAGVLPHIVIGDLDSLDDQTFSHISFKGIKVLRYPPEKDKTDMELGLEYITESLGDMVHDVLVLGGLGKRLDQTLANLFVLEKYASLGMRFRVVGEGVEVWVLSGPSRLSVEGEVGRIVSLLSLSRNVHGLRIKGLKYELNGVTLSFGSTLGISNELTGRRGEISFEEGVLLAVMET